MTDPPQSAGSNLAQFHSRIADIRLVSRIAGNALWQVALEHSGFCPGPADATRDIGVLRAASRNGAMIEVPVILVEEDERGEIWHLVEKPLSPGTEIVGIIFDVPKDRSRLQKS